MTTPTSYTRTTSFTNSFAAAPTQVFPGASLDVELNNIKTTLDQLIANSLLIQNNDGTLANLSVGTNQLSPSLQTGFTVPVVWASSIAYSSSPAATVFQNNGFYSCLKSHTSSASFANDLAAGDWVLIANLAGIPLVSASQIAVTPAGNITSTNTQSALQQLDTLKLNTTTFNALTSTQITDATTDGRNLLTLPLAGQRNQLGGPQIGDIKFTARIQIDPLWLWADGTAYLRTNYALLLNAITVATTGNTNGSTTISGIPIDLRGLGLEGAAIEGTNISAGATIASVTAIAIVITGGTISDTATGKALRIFPYGNGDGSTSFNVPKYNGTTLVARDNQGPAGAAGVLGTVATDRGTIIGSRLNSQGGSTTHAQTLPELFSHVHVATSTSIVTDPGHPHAVHGQSMADAGFLFTIGGTQDSLRKIVSGANGTQGALFVGNTQSATTGITVTTTTPMTTVGSSTAMAWLQPSTVGNCWIFAGV